MDAPASPLIVRVPTVLAGEVSRRRMRRPYRLYCAAKALDAAGCLDDGVGSGNVPLGKFVKLVAKTLGMSRSALRKALPVGDGVFWTIAAGRVWLWSQDRVAGGFGLSHAGKAEGRYPIEELARGNARFGAVLFDALQPQKAKRMSRIAQAKRTSVSETTQRRWERESVALHHDGNGRSPIASPRKFDDYSALIPSVSGSDMSVRAVAKVARDLGFHGFFGARGLWKEAPRPFAASGARHRRQVRRKYHGNSSSGLKAQRGTEKRWQSGWVGGLHWYGERGGLVRLEDRQQPFSPRQVVPFEQVKGGQESGRTLFDYLEVRC